MNKNKFFIKKSSFRTCGILLVMSMCIGCGEIKRVDTKAVKEHMNDYKIKKADQATIVLQAETWSQELTDSLQKRWATQMTSVQKQPAAKRQLLCEPMKDPFLDSLHKLYDLDVEIWGKNTQLAELPLPQEKELFSAYQYALENRLPLESNLQKSGDSLFLFTRSIPGFAALCFGDSTRGLSIVRLKISKASVVKSIPLRKK